MLEALKLTFGNMDLSSLSTIESFTLGTIVFIGIFLVIDEFLNTIERKSK